jgi:hypothetical protein
MRDHFERPLSMVDGDAFAAGIPAASCRDVDEQIAVI